MGKRAELVNDGETLTSLPSTGVYLGPTTVDLRSYFVQSRFETSFALPFESFLSLVHTGSVTRDVTRKMEIKSHSHCLLLLWSVLNGVLLV